MPGTGRAVPAAAFDVVQATAVVGGAAVLLGVALAFPAFLRGLRGGWAVLRRPILVAALATVVACGALVAVALDHDIVAASIFVAFAFASLFAWTRAATIAARRGSRLCARTASSRSSSARRWS